MKICYLTIDPRALKWLATLDVYSSKLHVTGFSPVECYISTERVLLLLQVEIQVVRVPVESVFVHFPIYLKSSIDEQILLHVLPIAYERIYLRKALFTRYL